MDAKGLRDRLSSEWSGVMNVWLDEKAASVEKASIEPLFQQLDETTALNQSARAEAEMFVEEARGL